MVYKIDKKLDQAQTRKYALYGPKMAFQNDIDEIQPIKFSNYARIGLLNFFESKPEKFLCRLAKGPPPQFRWLAWELIAHRLYPDKIDYEKFLLEGKDPNNKWQYDI